MVTTKDLEEVGFIICEIPDINPTIKTLEVKYHDLKRTYCIKFDMIRNMSFLDRELLEDRVCKEIIRNFFNAYNERKELKDSECKTD